ncbi:hypothetical protein ACF0H5_008025 [Mactra antiquata]
MISPKSVFVTGANRGIGLEFVKQLIKLPTPPKYVFAGCRNPDTSKDLQTVAESNDSVKIVQLDVTDQATVDEAYKTVQSTVKDEGLTLLINNAVHANLVELPDVTRDMMKINFDVNTIGPLMMVKTFLPLLQQASNQQSDLEMSCSRSAIINISSDSGSISDNYDGIYHGGLYPYKASKAALNMITSCLSLDLKKDGILCSAIHPGWVITETGGPNAEISTETCLQYCMEALELMKGEKWSGILYDCINKKIMGW